MFDSQEQLFCLRLVRTEKGLVFDQLSPRYTIMTLLGLRELECAGGVSPFDTNAIYKSMVSHMNWIQGVGDLGLMVWLTAIFAPDHLEDFSRRMDLDTALDRFHDARQARTTELSWFLAGLSHAAMVSRRLAIGLMDCASEAYRRIKDNQGGAGFFGHMSELKSLAGFVRGRIGSFADQIYPIYAMAKFATAFQIEEPLHSAIECASAICNAQGESGQWWWLYDSRTGRVASRYPVYSVHQHGMAPMGLFALEQAAGKTFRASIYRGLRWVFGENELRKDMRDLEANLIWRCIRPRNRSRKYLDTALSLVQSPRFEAALGPSEILYEGRPYELGWLLYAFAGVGARDSMSAPPIVGPLGRVNLENGS